MTEPVLWNLAAHTAAKHRVLRAYLDGWIPLMAQQGLRMRAVTSGSPRLLLVDGFAGSTPTGKVTIKASATTLCVITLKSGKGSCTLSTKKLAVGTRHLVATYSGSTDFDGSASAKGTLTVAK
jgi:hypothetical protein